MSRLRRVTPVRALIWLLPVAVIACAAHVFPDPPVDPCGGPFSTCAQTSRVVLVYRDLLLPGGPAQRSDRCSARTGPFTLLRADTPAPVAVEIARKIDAAGVPRLVDRALQRAGVAVPDVAVTVCVFAGENVGGLPYLGGVGGISLGGGQINLFLHPAPNGLERVEYTVAHEYHHEAERLFGPPSRTGPLNTVVREGKADNFAVALYPQLRPPHTEPLTDDEFRTAWHQLMTYEQNADGFGSEFMIGRFPGGPRWPGYRLGFEIVQSYLGSVRLPPSEWIKTPAADIAAHFRSTRRYASLFGPSRGL